MNQRATCSTTRSLSTVSPLYNRSLSPTPPRAEFSVRRKYILSPMLIVRWFCGDNSKNVSITAVQNGQRGLAPNRYTVAPSFKLRFAANCAITFTRDDLGIK